MIRVTKKLIKETVITSLRSTVARIEDDYRNEYITTEEYMSALSATYYSYKDIVRTIEGYDMIKYETALDLERYIVGATRPR